MSTLSRQYGIKENQ